MEIIKTLKQIPILRILLPLILGIFTRNLVIISQLLLILFLTISFVFIIVFSVIPYFKEKIVFQTYFGISIFVFFFFVGALFFSLKNIEVSSNDTFLLGIKNYVVTIKEFPQEKEKTFQIKVQLDVAVDSCKINCSNEGVIFYVSKADTLIKDLMPGDKLIVRQKLNLINNKRNPGEFDYKTFINRRGYSFTAYLDKDCYRILNKGNEVGLEYKIFKLRQLILCKLEKEFDSKTFAFLSSMLIGVKDDLDEETRESFSAAGITHLLAISGLHVGILYLALTYLLALLGNRFYVQLFRNIIIICTLWLYAILAGLSPSVIRATLMFSAIAVGELLSRKTIIYNSLGLAAFIMLMLNPNNLFEVGFQLSFLAVLGIVFFQPKINNLVVLKNKILKFLWSLISVSIAAQLATFPLTVYYFHQFPNYFIIGNLLAIPLFFINLMSGLIYIAFGWIPVVGPVFHFLTELIAELILKVSAFISGLRYSVTEGLFFSQLQVVFIYASLFFMAYFISCKRVKYLQIVLLSILMVFGFNFYELSQKKGNKTFTLYNNKTTLLSYINGFHSYTFTDSVNEEGENLTYVMKEHLIQQKSFKKSTNLYLNTNFEYGNFCVYNLPYENKLIVFEGEKILFLKNSKHLHNQKLNVDYIVLQDNVEITIEEILQDFNVKKMIFSTTNSTKNIFMWISECDKLGVLYHSISASGAFQLTAQNLQ